MQITKEKIDKLYKINSELVDLEEKANNESSVVRNGAERKRIKIERDGKKITVTEKILWDEVYFGGMESQAAKILKEKYPKVFEYTKKQTEKANELQMFIQAEFGIDYKKMRFSDIIKVVDALFDYKLNQKKDEK